MVSLSWFCSFSRTYHKKVILSHQRKPLCFHHNGGHINPELWSRSAMLFNSEVEPSGGGAPCKESGSRKNRGSSLRVQQKKKNRYKCTIKESKQDSRKVKKSVTIAWQPHSPALISGRDLPGCYGTFYSCRIFRRNAFLCFFFSFLNTRNKCGHARSQRFLE